MTLASRVMPGLLLATYLIESAVMGRGDRVECELLRESRGLKATQVRVVLGVPHAQAVTQPNGTFATGTTPTGFIGGSGLESLTDEELAVVSSVVDLLNERVAQGEPQVLLAQVGDRLRESVSGFSHQELGYGSLLGLLASLSRRSESFFIDRHPNGHPFIALGTPTVDESTVEGERA